MHRTAASIALALLLPALAGAEPRPLAGGGTGKLKVVLSCSTRLGNGKTVTLPVKKARFEQPITCVVSAQGAAPGLAAELRTTEGKTTKGSRTGTLGGSGNWLTTLEVDREFTTCVDFTIEASVRAADGAVLGKTSLNVTQFCPD